MILRYKITNQYIAETGYQDPVGVMIYCEIFEFYEGHIDWELLC